jgi:hypothetical protein
VRKRRALRRKFRRNLRIAKIKRRRKLRGNLPSALNGPWLNRRKRSTLKFLTRMPGRQ